MKAAIRARARELGFDECRFTSAAAPESAARFQHWLTGQRHGRMAYLERNAHKRINPDAVLSGAKSVVTLAASYATDAETDTNRTRRGVVARYARYRDYHEVLGARLKALAVPARIRRRRHALALVCRHRADPRT